MVAAIGRFGQEEGGPGAETLGLLSTRQAGLTLLWVTLGPLDPGGSYAASRANLTMGFAASSLAESAIGGLEQEEGSPSAKTLGPFCRGSLTMGFPGGSIGPRRLFCRRPFLQASKTELTMDFSGASLWQGQQLGISVRKKGALVLRL